MSSEIYVGELVDGLKWVNTVEPIRLANLRGKAVILSFWTSSSIACEQQSHELRLIETKFHDGVAILGIHTPKHPNEVDDAYLLKISNRWQIRYPVANDAEYTAWRQLGIESWPSLVLLDHDSRIVGIFAGEGRRSELEAKIQEVLDKALEVDRRSHDPAPVSNKPEARAILRFPTRIVASATHLYLADTGYNRIVELTFEGRINRQFGSGNPGNWDARLTEAGFRNPVGLALMKDFLFVADTGNHSIRRIRLNTGDVETLAGTGICERPVSTDSAQPRTLSLTSPVDVAAAHDKIYIAMAGSHQIWQLDLMSGSVSLFVGNGREDVVDGTGPFSSFAQPSGLTVAAESLYVLDASTSTLRCVRLQDARVMTLIPGGLFTDGSADGNAMAARMCHPTAVFHDSVRKVLWIADTLNHKLRVYSIAKAELKTLNVNYRLQSPSGICVADQTVFIANTDAHEILRLDLRSGRLARLPITT